MSMSLEERVITLFNNDNNNVFKAQITIEMINQIKSVLINAILLFRYIILYYLITV